MIIMACVPHVSWELTKVLKEIHRVYSVRVTHKLNLMRASQVTTVDHDTHNLG